ncbi:MAG: VanZ family protein [Pseudoxanthomonas suwonensis]|nr:VanZ family protein [Pseudoxanthomonas suwonensis]
MTRYRPGRSFKPLRWPWLWAGLWAAAIAAVVIGSMLPASDLQSLPSVNDKLLHFLGYFALAAGAVQLFARRSALLVACVAIGLLGIGLEWAQGAFASGRQMDPSDAVANCVGVLAGLATQFTPLRDALPWLEARAGMMTRNE